MAGWRHFLKNSHLKEALESILPDWLKPKTYVEIREAVLDRPRQTVVNRRKFIYRYAIFCATAPYALAATLLWVADFARVIPPDNFEQHMAMISSQEKELIEMSAERAALCDRLTTLNISHGRRCNKTFEELEILHQSDIDQQRNDAKSLASLQAAAANSVINSIIILLGSFIFSRVWLRFYPQHVQTTSDDIKNVSRSYLLVMSTTMFVPNCIGASIILLVTIIGRLDSVTATTISEWIIFAGLLPFAACSVLGCYRLNDVLLNTHSWRVGKTWIALVASNMITGFITLLIFAALFIIIAVQGQAIGHI